MTSLELDQLRREKWRTHGTPVATGDDARAFVASVGMCLLYAEKPAVLLPTLVGAVAGEDRDLPTAKQAFQDKRAARADELAAQLVRQRAVFEVCVFGDNPLLLSPAVFPYFYAIAGEARTSMVKHPPLSKLAELTSQAMERKGHMAPRELREGIGAELSDAGVERALHELWLRLRVMREERGERERWVTLERWAPDARNRAMGMSVAEALSALVSQYLQAVVAAEQAEVEGFFGRLVPRTRVRDCIQALLAAREFSQVNVGQKTLLQLTPPRVVDPRREAARTQPIARRRRVISPGKPRR